MAAIVLAIASLVWLWRATDPGSVWPLLERAHLPALVIGLGLLGGSLVAKALRWRAMLPPSRALGRVEAIRIFHVSILLNNLLPFRVGDGARVLSPSVRKSATVQQAVVVLVAERVLDTLTLAVAALLVLPPYVRATGRRAVLDGVSAPGRGALLIVGGAIVLGIVVLGVASSVRWHALRLLLAERFASLRIDIVALVQHPPRRVALLLTTTVVAWTTTFLLHYAVLVAFDPPTSLVHPLLLAVVVTLATNLSMLAPATPGGIGIFHAAAAAPLLFAGMNTDLAVAYALMLHAMNTVPPMIVGAVCLGAPAISSRLRGAEG